MEKSISKSDLLVDTMNRIKNEEIEYDKLNAKIFSLISELKNFQSKFNKKTISDDEISPQNELNQMIKKFAFENNQNDPIFDDLISQQSHSKKLKIQLNALQREIEFKRAKIETKRNELNMEKDEISRLKKKRESLCTTYKNVKTDLAQNQEKIKLVGENLTEFAMKLTLKKSENDQLRKILEFESCRLADKQKHIEILRNRLDYQKTLSSLLSSENAKKEDQIREISEKTSELCRAISKLQQRDLKDELDQQKTHDIMIKELESESKEMKGQNELLCEELNRRFIQLKGKEKFLHNTNLSLNSLTLEKAELQMERTKLTAEVNSFKM